MGHLEEFHSTGSVYATRAAAEGTDFPSTSSEE